MSAELESCLYCDTPAPMDEDGGPVYYAVDEGRKKLEPSCPGHATHGSDGLLLDARLRMPAKPERRSKQ